MPEASSDAPADGDPRSIFFTQLNSVQVVYRDMPGQVTLDDGRLFFVPDAAAALAPAYLEIAIRMGGSWERLEITHDAAALGVCAQAAGLDYLVVSKPSTISIATFGEGVQELVELFEQEWVR